MGQPLECLHGSGGLTTRCAFVRSVGEIRGRSVQLLTAGAAAPFTIKFVATAHGFGGAAFNLPLARFPEQQDETRHGDHHQDHQDGQDFLRQVFHVYIGWIEGVVQILTSCHMLARWKDMAAHHAH